MSVLHWWWVMVSMIVCGILQIQRVILFIFLKNTKLLITCATMGCQISHWIGAIGVGWTFESLFLFWFSPITVQNGLNNCCYGFTSMCNYICCKVFFVFFMLLHSINSTFHGWVFFLNFFLYKPTQDNFICKKRFLLMQMVSTMWAFIISDFFSCLKFTTKGNGENLWILHSIKATCLL